MLLVAAGLLLRSFLKTLNAELGFNAENVLVFDLSQPNTKAPTVGHRVRFVREILERVGQIPGSRVRHGVVHADERQLLLWRSRLPRGPARHPHDSRFSAGFDSVEGDYFRTLGIPCSAGASSPRRITTRRRPRP